MILVNFERFDGLSGRAREKIAYCLRIEKIADTDFVEKLKLKGFKEFLFLDNVKDKYLFRGICTV